jgi:hypothetical protein
MGDFNGFEDELMLLKDKYNSLILQTKGSFTYLIIEIDQKLKLKIAFQPESYPKTAPSFIKLVHNKKNNLTKTDEDLVDSFLRDTTNHLKEIIDNSNSRPCIVEVVNTLAEIFESNSKLLNISLDLIEPIQQKSEHSCNSHPENTKKKNNKVAKNSEELITNAKFFND